MKPAQPYRAPLPIPHREPAPVDPVWRRYRRSVRIYNLSLATMLLGFTLLAFDNPVALPGAFLLIVHGLFAMFAWVRHYRCPRCDQSLITGIRAPSTWALTFGVFPRECTHCGATDERAACVCEGCRDTASASS